jgi:hypothetical protein
MIKSIENRRIYQREYMKNWRKKHPLTEEQKHYQKEYNKKRDYFKWYHNKIKNNPDFIRKKKEYYQKNKLYFRKKSKECYERTKNKVKERWIIKRLKVLDYYGKKCVCCGEQRIEFLAIDHINNDGYKQRKMIKTNIYDWIIKNSFPKDLQILCHNCNLSKAFYGYCPHKEVKNEN